MRLTEDEIIMMSGWYRHLFLDPPELVGVTAPGRHRPGPLKEDEPPLGRRHLAHPLARVLVGAMFAKVCLLPMLTAENADERDAVGRAILRIVGVEPLLTAGVVRSATVCWSRTRWPRRPVEVRVGLAGGEAQRRRLLGALEGHVRRMVEAMTAENYDVPRRRPRSGGTGGVGTDDEGDNGDQPQPAPAAE